MKVVVCATHPWNTNGYSLVMSNLVTLLAARDDVEKIWYFGFQNVSGDQSRNKRALPAKVEVFDALAHEEPRMQGFGEELVRKYVDERDPDAVVISNDSIVVERLTAKLAEGERRYKIVVYQDLVYEHMKHRFVEQLNTRVDRVLAFTQYWKEHMQGQGVKTPIDVVKHGFDPVAKFPVDQAVARRYFGLRPNDFIILNLNRNQPRKRWDICMKAFAEFVSMHRGEAVKLLVGTAMSASWDLLAIYERELGKRGIPLEEGRRHLILIDAPQRLSDEDVNILMNCADIGITASDGEGFGLCNFEHAALGRPQVVSNVGGHQDFFKEGHAHLCQPAMAYYVDASRDGVGGEAQLINYMDMVEGMELYYSNPALREEHGRAARKHIVGSYSWQAQADAMHAALAAAIGDTVQVADEIDLIPDVSVIADEEPAKEPEPAAKEPAAEPEPAKEPAKEPEPATKEPAKEDGLGVKDIQEKVAAAAPAAAPAGDGEINDLRQQLAALTALVEKMAAR